MTTIAPVLPAQNPYGTDPFLTERQYRLERFCLLAPQLQGMRVALHGTGANARDVVGRLGDVLDIACLVDDARAGGCLWGLSVVSLEEALAMGIDLMVIAAKADSTDAVYRRVGAMARARGIPVIDLYGNDLHVLYDTATRRRRADAIDLREAVKSYDLLCIDAMLLRAPDGDVWYLDDTLPATATHAAMGLLIAARASGTSVVRLEEGENGLAILPIFGDVAQGGGACSKENGAFRILRSMAPSTSRVMHVGPDANRDVTYALYNGIDGFALELATPVMARRRPGASCRLQRATHAAPDAGDPTNEVEAALCEELAMAPASTSSPEFLYGYRSLGPLLAGFMPWLREGAASVGAGRLLFCARDSYLAFRVWEALRESCSGMLPATYLLTSRKSAIRPLLGRPVVAMGLAAHSAGMSPGEMLLGRFGLSKDELRLEAPSDADGDLARLRAVLGHADAIALHAREALDGQARYLDRLGLEPDGTYALVELAASGTCQRMLSQYVPYDLFGLYLARRPDAHVDAREPIRSFLTAPDGYLLRHVMAIEALCGSCDPPLAGFDAGGDPLYDDDPRTVSDLATIREVQRGALALARAVSGSVDLSSCDPARPEFLERLLSLGDGCLPHVTTTNSWTGESQADVRYDGGHER